MDPLAEYVQRRVSAGLSRTRIREELAAVGWSEEQADAAYREALLALGAPAPGPGSRAAPAGKSSTVDIVINFFSFILLGIAAIALGTLYFRVIDEYFRTPLARYGAASALGLTGAIHYAIASLVIAAPLYFAAVRLWFRKFRDDASHAESRLTRWLTYLVLLVASVTIVGDLIAALFKFLQGEGTARFFLKALVILVIAGFVFAFYFLERRRIQYRRPVPRAAFKGLGGAAAGFAVLGLVLGFVAAGSPATARKLALDHRRASDLSRLSGCIDRYARNLGELPASLADLRRAGGYSMCSVYMRDPRTRQEYGYRVVAPSRVHGNATVGDFELCADFALASRERGASFLGIWGEHGAGRSCHTATAQLVGKAAPGQRAR